MWKILSAILHMGDIKPVDGGSDEDPNMLIASSLLGCQATDLSRWLSNRKITVSDLIQ
jgi:hypothetical protein